MHIPVFVSAPSTLNPVQEKIYSAILELLSELNIERRALGRSDYPTELPLREVIRLARKCSGGIILGFKQIVAKRAVSKPGTVSETILKDISFPTPWNNLEAGILFSLGLPMLVFHEEGVSGGVFDKGVTDVFVHKMPTAIELADKNAPVREVVLKWQGQVRSHYYHS